jgi:hypothetical protein
VFEKDELAARSQDPSHTLQRLHDARYRAQRKGAHNGIDAGVPQGNAFARQIQKLDVQLRPAPLLFG